MPAAAKKTLHELRVEYRHQQERSDLDRGTFRAEVDAIMASPGELPGITYAEQVAFAAWIAATVSLNPDDEIVDDLDGGWDRRIHEALAS